MVSLTELHLRAVRARIAHAVAPPAVDPRLGSILLRRDQCASAARVHALLDRHGGCLLADDVGRGKTYVALAVARRWSRPLVVVPASLRSTWTDAMRRACVPCALVTHEALSRGRLPDARHDGIIVDESHRFRSTTARRHAALATLAARAPLLLLSATPLQNRTRDLAAQVALFQGGRAFRMDAGALAAFVVRGAEGEDPAMPLVAPPAWVRPDADDGAVLEAILALPRPARPADGGEVGVLRTIGLVRAWASSRAALVAMLRRRRRVATAIEQCAADGLLPTKRDIRSWDGADGGIQLGFAPLLVRATAGRRRAHELLEEVAREHEALARLQLVMAAAADPDDARVRTLRAIRAAHPGESVLAFTELASTARAFHARMRDDPGVGLLTARDARIASGRLPRDELLARFSPRAQGAPSPADRERVTLLVATDLLSEGVNLQDASVVVHLDLPWNPARLAQRVGRVRRPGGAAVVHGYLVAPPARAELLLQVEQRLRRKLAEVARTIGRSIDVVPRLATGPEATAPDAGRATMLGELADRIARWSRPSGSRACRGSRRPLVAGAESAVTGWLAALDDGRLVASLDGEPPGTGEVVARAAPRCEGRARPVGATEALARVDECNRWLDMHELARACGAETPPSDVDADIERGIAIALRRARRHERPALIVMAARLRAALGVARPLGVERALRAALRRGERAGDAEWLAEALELVTPQGGERGAAPPERGARPRVIALVVLVAPGPVRREGMSGSTNGMVPERTMAAGWPPSSTAMLKPPDVSRCWR